MNEPQSQEQTIAAVDRYQALLAVSDVIISHREVSSLFHDLAGRLHDVVRFDCLALILYEPANNTLRLQVLEPPELSLPASILEMPVKETSGGQVWLHQQPIITATPERQAFFKAYAAGLRLENSKKSRVVMTSGGCCWQSPGIRSPIMCGARQL